MLDWIVPSGMKIDCIVSTRVGYEIVQSIALKITRC